MTTVDTQYRKIAAILIAAWFAIALTASALGVFFSPAGSALHPPLPLGLAVVLPLAIFAVWMASSAGFRQFIHSLDSRLLTLFHAWRIGGFVFLVLATYHILPRPFALSAGWGDITIGLTAPLAAFYLARGQHRAGFIAWQLLGVADLVAAVVLGVLSSATPIGVLNHGVNSGAMGQLPLSLIPTFAVPLLLILHVICIAQAIRWPARAQTAHRMAFGTAR